jgi:hypothetical protein
MKYAMAAALCCIIPTLAFAEVATPAPSAPDKSTELTYAQVLSAYQGLAALDGYQKVVEEGGRSKAIPQPYDFAELTREAIADDEIALKAAIDDEQAKAKIFIRGIGEEPKPDTPEAKKREKDIADYSDNLLGKKFKIVLTLLNRDELKLATNQIPPSVLAALDPVTKKK